jgi:hypothetical protein
MRPSNRHVLVRSLRTASAKLLVAQHQVPSGKRRVRAEPIRKPKKSPNLLASLVKQAIKLTSNPPDNWWSEDIQRADRAIAATSKLMRCARGYEKRKAREIIRVLTLVRSLACERLAQIPRQAVARPINPERNRIAEFNSASGRIRWGTRK